MVPVLAAFLSQHLEQHEYLSQLAAVNLGLLTGRPLEPEPRTTVYTQLSWPVLILEDHGCLSEANCSPTKTWLPRRARGLSPGQREGVRGQGRVWIGESHPPTMPCPLEWPRLTWTSWYQSLLL